MELSSRRFLTALTLLACFGSTTVAFDCSLKPIYVDVHPRAVHALSTYEYGSFIGLGSPAQNLSLWPSIENNETSVAGLGICDGDSDAKCGDKTGGLFSISESTSFRQDPQHQSLDLSSSSNVSIGTDTLHLYTHFFESDGASDTAVPELPVAVLDSPPRASFSNSSADTSSVFSTVGLGATSTLLQALYSQGKISSRSFGLYIGQAQLPLPSSGDIAEVTWHQNGSLTLGGYDSARFADPVTSYHLQEPANGPTALKVQVEALELSFINTEKPATNLLNSSATSKSDSNLTAFISTSTAPIVVPSAVLSALESATSGLPRTASISLTVTLSSSNGPANYTIPFTPGDIPSLIVATSSPSDPSLLGLPFLSNTYLTVSYDSNTFYLSPAIPSAPYIIPNTMCPKTTPARYVPPREQDFSKQGLVGAIIGGLIASIALVAVAICGTRSWRRRRAEKKVRFRLGLEEEMEGGMREHRLRFWRRDRI
ncbi:MAG: hypothetical protein Q9227_008343 [Pyrenula ochraceoflavens]